MCTGLRLTAADGSTVHGRTCEFGIELDLDVLFVPAGTPYSSPLESGPGMTFTSRHAVVGASCFGAGSVLDGINDQGLAVGGFYFPGWAEYAPAATSDPASSLNCTDLGHWLLSTCATLDDVRAAVSTVSVVDSPIAAWGGILPPFHYIAYGPDGASVVIEPRGGKLEITDNPIGVLTNAPEFAYHLMNLSQFTNITTGGVPQSRIAGTTVTAFGMGSGGLGVPGDFSPPSRFVRAALFSANHPTPPDSTAAVHEVFHLLNTFDVPKGFVTEQLDGQTADDWTLATVVRDPAHGLLYFRTYGDQSIRSVDLGQLVASGAPVSRVDAGPTTGAETPVTDATASLTGAA